MTQDNKEGARMTPDMNTVEIAYNDAPDDFDEIMELSDHDILLVRAIRDFNYREKIFELLYPPK